MTYANGRFVSRRSLAHKTTATVAAVLGCVAALYALSIIVPAALRAVGEDAAAAIGQLDERLIERAGSAVR
ncbi:MAG TPA: hypothetical protein VFY28_02055 [Candidatus Paceibacterota bacterium]|nr:hypothetical protein [Candidatus Paceibacterota bacterium]